MIWRKKGLLFTADKLDAWMFSHAANPVPIMKPDGLLRVFFTSRDISSRSHIGWCDLNPVADFKVMGISDAPVLTPGEIGLFDDSGVTLACIVPVGSTWHLYYLGWNLAVTVPWHNSIGLAIGDPFTGKFTKHSLAPMMDRDATDPYSVSYPFVLEDEGKFKMWYGTNRSWGAKQEEMDHVLKYADSNDGIHWSRSGIVSLDHIYDGEYAVSRPFVKKEGGIYKMWFSYRPGPEGATYRIGYAESEDGIRFTRKDQEVGITVSQDGWDQEMVCYPSIFEFGGKTMMLYNGNGYGKSGFGLAVLEK
jgi:hypothetical protein